MNKYTNVDEYIDGFSGSTKVKLQQIRECIRKEVPNATEVISYGIPTYKLQRNLIHFAGYNKHVAIYPGVNAVKQFSTKLENYKTSKGTIQFPLDNNLPLSLIKEIVRYCVDQQLSK